MGEGVAVTLGVMVGVDTGMADRVAMGVEVAAGRAISAPKGECQQEREQQGEDGGHGVGSVSWRKCMASAAFLGGPVLNGDDLSRKSIMSIT